ncbi:MAG: nucleotidyltransferase domain-containing protein [Chloroflexi bacterium]|nr:MAG: nucleotidyltransferase domain-containing protein [Chloroflexota bacterium]
MKHEWYNAPMAISEKWQQFSPLPADIHDRLSQLTALFTGEGVLLAYLFGSLVNAGAAHDVDLALLLPLESKRPYHLRPAIIDILGTERIDIVDLRRASPVLKFEIIRSGNCLYASGDDQQFMFETAVIRQYQDTAVWRQHQQEILKARMLQWS